MQGHGGAIRVGVGGWTFEPWRDNFYPKSLPAAKELEYASRQLNVIFFIKLLLGIALEISVC